MPRLWALVLRTLSATALTACSGPNLPSGTAGALAPTSIGGSVYAMTEQLDEDVRVQLRSVAGSLSFTALDGLLARSGVSTSALQPMLSTTALAARLQADDQRYHTLASLWRVAGASTVRPDANNFARGWDELFTGGASAALLSPQAATVSAELIGLGLFAAFATDAAAKTPALGLASSSSGGNSDNGGTSSLDCRYPGITQALRNFVGLNAQNPNAAYSSGYPDTPNHVTPDSPNPGFAFFGPQYDDGIWVPSDATDPSAIQTYPSYNGKSNPVSPGDRSSIISTLCNLRATAQNLGQNPAAIQAARCALSLCKQVR